MLQLQISTQPTRLVYSSHNAQPNPKTTQPLLTMETKPPLLEIHQPHGELTIDSTPCRSALGFKTNADFARDNAQYGQETALKTIGKIAQEGDRLSAIQNKANTIANIAADNSRHTEIPRVTLNYVPLPQITYQAKPVEFNLDEGKVSYKLIPGTVQGDYQPAGIDFQVNQYAKVEYSTVDVEV